MAKKEKKAVTSLEESVLKAVIGDAKSRRIIGKTFNTTDIITDNKQAGALSTLQRKGFLSLGVSDGRKIVSVTEAGYNALRS